MAYKNIAVVGAGLLGSLVVKALVSQNANVIVLTRPESDTKDLPVSVRQVRVSFTDVEAVAAALTEHHTEVIISTVGTTVIPAQIPIADAAKKAGVKLFVTSEFGVPTDGATEGPLGDKVRVAAHLKELGIPSVRIYNGLFSAFVPWLANISDGKFRIVGAGTTKQSFTDLGDIAGFAAYVTTHVPPSELEDKVLRIEGESLSLVEVAALYGDKVTVEHVEKLDGFQDHLQRTAALGHASTGWDPVSGKNVGAGSANKLWEGHKWVTVKESLGL